MANYNRLLISNGMLLANLLAIWCSSLISYFLIETISPSDQQILKLGWGYTQFLEWVYILIVGGITIWYELPIRRVLKMMRVKIPIDTDLALKARQRLLNEPYIIAALDFIIWIIAGLAIIVFLIYSGIKPLFAYLEGIDILLTALITVTAAFFMLQYFLQKKLTPIFFPEGQLATVPGTQKTMIRKTLLSLSLALNLIPLSIIIFTHLNYAYKHPNAFGQNPLLSSLNTQVVILSVIFVCVGIFLTLIVSKSISQPLMEITHVLKKIGRGDLNSKVQVTTNDEIGYTGDVINKMTEGLKEREIIKDVFGKYVAEDVRDKILSGKIPLDGEKKFVTALFCDLRNFTSMMESNDPKLIIKIMNSYFAEMNAVIRNQGGLILQYIGDEIFAVFGAPVDLSDHASRAFHAGLKMNHRLVELNLKFRKNKWPLLQHGIGIHTGEALAANIGSPDRMSYTLIWVTILILHPVYNL